MQSPPLEEIYSAHAINQPEANRQSSAEPASLRSSSEG